MFSCEVVVIRSNGTHLHYLIICLIHTHLAHSLLGVETAVNHVRVWADNLERAEGSDCCSTRTGIVAEALDTTHIDYTTHTAVLRVGLEHTIDPGIAGRSLFELPPLQFTPPLVLIYRRSDRCLLYH